MFHSFAFCCLCFWRLVVFADGAVKIISAREGDSVTLESTVTQIQKRDLITWTFGPLNTKIAEIDKDAGIFSTYDNVPDGRFSNRLELDHQTGSLIITHTRTTDSGLYNVTISRTGEKNAIRFNVTVYGHLMALISAAAVGLLLLIAAVGIFYIYRKRRKTDQQETDQTRNEDVTYADPTFLKRKAQKSEVKVEEEVVYAGVIIKH